MLFKCRNFLFADFTQKRKLSQKMVGEPAPLLLQSLQPYYICRQHLQINIPTTTKQSQIFYSTLPLEKMSSNKRENADFVSCYRLPALILRKFINICVQFSKYLQHFRKITNLKENISSTLGGLLKILKTCHKFIFLC